VCHSSSGQDAVFGKGVATVLLLAVQSLEETERLVAEGQGLPPPEIPLSTLPDHHLGDGLLGGLLDEVPAMLCYHTCVLDALPFWSRIHS
jgi:hypothetical protein